MTSDVILQMSSTSVSNALVTTGDGSGLDAGVYTLTFSVASSFTLTFYPIVNFTISVVEGKFLFC